MQGPESYAVAAVPGKMEGRCTCALATCLTVQALRGKVLRRTEAGGNRRAHVSYSCCRQGWGSPALEITSRYRYPYATPPSRGEEELPEEPLRRNFDRAAGHYVDPVARPLQSPRQLQWLLDQGDRSAMCIFRSCWARRQGAYAYRAFSRACSPLHGLSTVRALWLGRISSTGGIAVVAKRTKSRLLGALTVVTEAITRWTVTLGRLTWHCMLPSLTRRRSISGSCVRLD